AEVVLRPAVRLVLGVVPQRADEALDVAVPIDQVVGDLSAAGRVGHAVEADGARGVRRRRERAGRDGGEILGEGDGKVLGDAAAGGLAGGVEAGGVDVITGGDHVT